MPARTVNGAAIFYEEAGTGAPPIVLLHSFPLDSRVWEAQREALSDRFRVITPDLRGWGQSKSSDPFTIESYADDVHALLESIGEKRVILGGVSMGGYISMAYAKKYPADLVGLILVDTRAEADTPEGRETRDRMIELVRSKGSEAIATATLPKMFAPATVSSRGDVTDAYRAIATSQSPVTIANALAALRDRPDFRDTLGSIAVPTLILVGDQDATTPPANAETLNKSIPRSQLVTIKNAGHQTPMEQPEQVTAAIRDFASKLA